MSISVKLAKLNFLIEQLSDIANHIVLPSNINLNIVLTMNKPNNVEIHIQIRLCHTIHELESQMVTIQHNSKFGPKYYV